MLSEMRNKEVIAICRRPAKPLLLLVFGAMVLLGAAVFLYGISGPDSERIWQAYLINFVFWTGMAAGCVLFSAILSITHAHWGRSLKRLAEAPVFFLPVALVLFAVLYPGREKIFPWILHPVEEKAAWLNAPFLFLRDGLGLFALALGGIALILISVRREKETSLPQPEQPGKEKNREERPAVIAANIYAIPDDPSEAPRAGRGAARGHAARFRL